MSRKVFAPIVLLTLGLTVLIDQTPAAAENLQQVQQLLSTKQCVNCDLSGAGLVFANLSGAKLTGANLSGANLSRANLSGADLTGANLSGAALVGVNLSRATLANANLTSVDLREAFLADADLTNTRLDNALLQKTIGLSPVVGSAEDFYRWAMEAGERRNYGMAAENFNQALTRKPDFAAAYLGRAVARFELGDMSGAVRDSQYAERLFTEQGDANSSLVAQQLSTELTIPAKDRKPRAKFGQTLVNVLGGLLQMFLQ